MNDNLFLNDGLEKTADSIILDTDTTKWVKTIITEFLSKYPVLSNEQMTVTWTKIDRAKGYAVGTLNILNGAVPLIVKNFRMYPMDVIMFGSEIAMPLTPEFLGDLITKETPFKGLANANKKDSLDIFTDSNLQFSPINDNRVQQGNSSSIRRDAVKVAEFNSFIDRIEHIDKDAVIDMLTKIAEDPYTIKAFEENGTFEVIEKLANRKFITKTTELEEFVRELEIDRQYVFEDEQGNKFVKQANSTIDYTWTIEIDAVEAEKLTPMLAEQAELEKLEKIASVKSHILTNIEVGATGTFVTPKDEKLTNISILDIEKSQPLQKFAFLTGKYDNSTLICDDEQNYYILEDQKLDKVASNASLEATTPKIGDYGIFFQDNEYILGPVEIKAHVKVAGVGNEYYNVANGLGTLEVYPLNVDFDGLRSHDVEKRAVYLPKSAKFVKLGKNLSNSSIFKLKFDELLKTASYTNVLRITASKDLQPIEIFIADDDRLEMQKLSNNQYVLPKSAHFVEERTFTKVAQVKNQNDLIGRDKTGFYYLMGENFDKFAQNGHEIRNLTLNEAIWSGIQCGLSEAEVEKIAKLNYDSKFVVENELKVPISLESLVKKAETIYDDIVQEIADIPSLVKEAASLKQKDTVDAVLSLGLIKKHNILEYTSLIEDYERVVGELSKLLVYTRLGLIDLDEYAVSSAVKSIAKIIYLLKRVRKIGTLDENA